MASLLEIAFDGVGCVISQATASMIAELVKDKSIHYVIALTASRYSGFIGMDLGPTRLKCALLSYMLCKKGYKTILKKDNNA